MENYFFKKRSLGASIKIIFEADLERIERAEQIATSERTKKLLHQEKLLIAEDELDKMKLVDTYYELEKIFSKHRNDSPEHEEMARVYLRRFMQANYF